MGSAEAKSEGVSRLQIAAVENSNSERQKEMKSEAELLEIIKLLREALVKIQWHAELGFWEEGGCGECTSHDDQGHTDDCIVGKALKASEAAPCAVTQALEEKEVVSESVKVSGQNDLSLLSNEQLNRKLAKRLGWTEGFYATNPPQITWWHDDIGDGPPLNYCDVFGRKYVLIIAKALE